MEFRILGPLEVDVDHRSAPVRAGNDRLVLALLLVRRNRIVSLDSLVDELWEGAGAIWVTNRTRGTLLQIDPRTAAITRTIRLGFKPHWVRVIGDDVWIGIGSQELEDAGT